MRADGPQITPVRAVGPCSQEEPLAPSAIAITRIHTLPPDLAPLVVEARAEGFRFIDRLVEEWGSGVLRFDGPGEAFFAARDRTGGLLGVGGLSRDPYSDDPSLGRVRKIFVLGAARRCGVGAAIVRTIVEHARGRFVRLRLRTETASGARFYEAIGFAPLVEPDTTHGLALD